VAGSIGYLLLKRIVSVEGNLDIKEYHGLSSKYKLLGLGFLLCGIAVAGFPITPTFIGEDLIFSHIHENQLLIAMLSSTIFIMNGLAVVRLYARLFLGPYRGSIGIIPTHS
jgi:formate hydrogenlyase subunit 3/multisubunit Na+/H+ antiporter MnhD subunit